MTMGTLGLDNIAVAFALGPLGLAARRPSSAPIQRMNGYRGRLAPSPTGLLHLGHARTFWTAYERALVADGALILRDEDLDIQRARADYASAMIEDLRWLGLDWDGALTFQPDNCVRPPVCRR